MKVIRVFSALYTIVLLQVSVISFDASGQVNQRNGHAANNNRYTNIWAENQNGLQFPFQLKGSLTDEHNIPYLRLPNIPIPEGKTVSEVRIEAIRVSEHALSRALPKELDEMRLNSQSQWIQSWEVGYQQGRPFLMITLKPWNLDGNQIVLLEEYEVKLTYQNSSVSRQFSRSFATQSVLAEGSGSWYKAAVRTDGMYKIDRAYVQSLGVNPDTIDPSALHIFGNGFGLLPELNSKYRPDDLRQLSVLVSGGGDGSFDVGDYILFFAKGPHKWEYDTLVSRFNHTLHIYDNDSYYFLNYNPSRPAKHIADVTLPDVPHTHVVNSFKDFAFIENETFNLLKSGREWYGDKFDVQTSFNYAFNFPNIIGQADLTARVLGNSGTASSSFTLSVNGNPGSKAIAIGQVGVGTYAPQASITKETHSFVPFSSQIQVQLTYNKNAPSNAGWLDYLEVNVNRQLTMTGSQMMFRNVDVLGVGNIARYELTNAQNILHIWDVTSHDGVTRLNLPYQTTPMLTWTAPADSIREYIAFTGVGFPSPRNIGKVEHQNLHSLEQQDFIIIVPTALQSEAERLASKRREQGMRVVVVTPNQVYNEFSSGMADATAYKDFVRMFYKRANGNITEMPKHLMLFGDGSYDNKGNKFSITNNLLTYQSQESVKGVSSYTTDDYFGLLDDHENMGSNHLLDIGIGRLPVKTGVEAREAVDKILRYETNSVPDLAIDCCNQGNSTLGDWRNMVTFIADDEDYNAYVNGCEAISSIIDSNYRSYAVEKIYLDAYQQATTPGGQRYPDVNEAFNRRVQSGAMLINYIGHGGELGLAHERILGIGDVRSWNNAYRMPLFMTATCEFSRFDDPERTSAGEHVFLNPMGGGIALLTTTRLVYSWPNEVLNTRFMEITFEQPEWKGQNLGEIFMKTKNNTIMTPIGGDNLRNFTLLGDPSLRLAIPYYQVVTDSINGVSLSVSTDTIRALSKVRISGHITDPQTGALLTGFNGIIYPTVYDKISDLTTLGQDPTSFARAFKMWKNVVYSGKATVTNGRFSFEFRVPKDVRLDFGKGRIRYYVHDQELDGQGNNMAFYVGGTDTSAANDTEGPQLNIFLNTPEFVSGGYTGDNPVLIAELFDENGINTVGTGIGHDITVVLDENTANTRVLNEFYQADLDTYKSGKVRYELGNLSAGPHTLRFKAWDVYNNSSEEFIEFTVMDADDFKLEHVLNYPNPFTTATEFMFEHNQSCNVMDVRIQVFTVSGKLVKTINERVDSKGFRVAGIMWDGLDDYGDRMGRGTYVYRLEARDELGQQAEKIEKLVILR